MNSKADLGTGELGAELGSPEQEQLQDSIIMWRQSTGREVLYQALDLSQNLGWVDLEKIVKELTAP